MNCKKCGNPLLSEGALCKFCGVALSPEELKERNNLRNPNNSFRPDLLTDRYNVDKSSIYKEEKPKENKILGLIIIIVILLFLIILAILLNGGN